MSILNTAQRPIIEFDVTKLEHRQAYRQFMRTNCWGHLPYRFKIEAPFLSLVAMIEDRMCRFYLSQEFGND